jgi:hypothetical protein
MIRLRQVVTLAGALVALAVPMAACGPQGQAPVMDPIDVKPAYVGQLFTLNLRASTASGDQLTFSFAAPARPDLANKADIRAFGNGANAVFEWTPNANDVGTWAVDFTVSDGGMTTTETVNIEVKPGVSEGPVFRKPLGPGTTLDLGLHNCVDVEVVVEDTSVADVKISLEPLQGSVLSATGPQSATFHWCPTAGQIASQMNYALVFSADDGQAPKVTKTYTIHLQQDGTSPSCTSAAPTVTHSPADETTSSGLTIGPATISDDQGVKSPPTLYYSYSPIPTPPVLTNLNPVAMVQITGDLKNGTWAADVPNPIAGQAAGTQADVYYVIVAADQDNDSGTACPHTTQMPVSGAYHEKVTIPGGSAPVCHEDSLEPDDNAGQARLAYVHIQDSTKENGRQICSGNDDWYMLYLNKDEVLYASLTFTQNNAMQDLDFHFYDDTVDLTPCNDTTPCTPARGQSGDSNEYFTMKIPHDGTYYLVVHGYNGSENSYDFCVSILAGQCPVY